MLLRAGSEMTGAGVSVAGITEQEITVGVKDEALLNAFVEATLGIDQQKLQVAWRDLLEGLGAQAVVDVAAVIANFMQMVRIADATGTPLDEAFVEGSATVRAELGINSIPSAQNTPGIGTGD